VANMVSGVTEGYDSRSSASATAPRPRVPTSSSWPSASRTPSCTRHPPASPSRCRSRPRSR
jgi:hypothetical protein